MFFPHVAGNSSLHKAIVILGLHTRVPSRVECPLLIAKALVGPRIYDGLQDPAQTLTDAGKWLQVTNDRLLLLAESLGDN